MAKVESVYNYVPPDEYEGTCTLCNHKNTRTDWDNTMKSADFAEMYCSYCRHQTTHVNVHKKSK